MHESKIMQSEAIYIKLYGARSETLGIVEPSFAIKIQSFSDLPKLY